VELALTAFARLWSQPMAWVLLSLLTGLAAFSSLSITQRAKPSGRAEAFVLLVAVFYAIIVTPVFGLGYTHQLRPWLLAIASLATSTAGFLLSAWGKSKRDQVHDTCVLAYSLFKLPWDALKIALAARSFAVLGIVAAAWTIGMSLWVTYLAPSEVWDGFFCHEPMVGFAIQNHGFSVVPLGNDPSPQTANGFPRLCQSFALWFVIFTDKTLIEIGNSVAAAGVMMAFFVIARRYSSDIASLMGWAATVLLVPALFSQLRSTMIDVQVAFFLLAAAHFATRPALRVRDAAAAVLCMALIVGSKSSGPALVVPLAAVTFSRLLWGQVRKRPGPVLGLIAAGSLLVSGVAALTFVRNWIAFDNPFWPVSYSIPWLNIRWRGLIALPQFMHPMALLDLARLKYDHPVGGVGDILQRDYGYGVPWVVLPLSLVSAAVACVVALVARLRRRPDKDCENLLLVLGLSAVFIVLSPSLTIARYNVQIIAMMIAAIAWLAGRISGGFRLNEGAMACTLVISLVTWYWTGWLFGLDLDVQGIIALTKHGAKDRAAMHVATFTIPAEVARARERDLQAGDLVVFTQGLAMPGGLWNHKMSNRLQYVFFDEPKNFLQRMDDLKPKWVVVPPGAAQSAMLSRPEWEQVGLAERVQNNVIFRRKR
jgi:hypothetical protein